jgi:hypothetical protein
LWQGLRRGLWQGLKSPQPVSGGHVLFLQNFFILRGPHRFTPSLDNVSNLLIITSMPYTRRPFQPETPYANQVSIELNKANDNFDILAQAFVSDNPETFKVKNASYSDNSDKLDGFDASLTPAPNVIVPLNSAGILDLSATYVKSNVYTFRRVNLTGATSDYELQVGEEAYIEFSNATTVPLRIAVVSGAFYEVILNNTENKSVGFTYLLPNNTTYSSSFSGLGLYYNSGGGSGWAYYSNSYSSFVIYNQTPSVKFYIDTIRRKLFGIAFYEFGTSGTGFGFIAGKWHTFTDNWTSLGTLQFPTTFSGYILIRRLR